MTSEQPNSVIQKSLQQAWGGYSWVLFSPWHFISWIWVAPHKKWELHPSIIYHPQTLTDLAGGMVIQYTEGGLKIATVWLSCLHCVSKHWQPQSSHLQHLKTSCAIGIACPHTKVMKFLMDMKAMRPEKRQSGQKSWLHGYWTKPLLPTPCISALKTDESRKWVERAAQYKLSSITTPLGREKLKYTDSSTSTVCNQYVCSGIKQTPIIKYWRNAGLHLMYSSNWSRNNLSLCKSCPCKSAKVSVTLGYQLLEVLAKLNCLEQALNLHTRLLGQNVCLTLSEFAIPW